MPSLRVGAALVVLAAAGCRRAPATASAHAVGGATSPGAPTPRPTSSIIAPRTTDPAIALGNLDGEIAAGRQLAGRPSPSALALVGLSGALLRHGALVGHLAEYDEAEALAEQAVKLAPAEPQAWMGRAAVRSRFHRFDDALADLARAAALGETGREIEQRRAAILQAQGRVGEARPTREKWVRALPTFDSLLALATVDVDEGRFAEAERGFAAAPAQFRDVSPFPLVQLWLQQAALAQEMGRPARARELLEEAHERMPVDAAVISHLASACALTGDRSRAIALLGPLVARSDDPEHAALLAELLAAEGRDDEARALVTRAAARYTELLAAHPAAFADHAARFYLGAGKDPARAARLAEDNLRLRRTAAAYQLALDALAAAGDAARACAVADEAERAWPRFAHLHAQAWAAYQRCGQKQKAEDALRASAAPAP